MPQPKYGVVEEPKKERGPVRKALVPVLMFAVVFYSVLTVQALAKLIATKLAGGIPVLYLGMGANLRQSELIGIKTIVAPDWWWGPQVLAGAIQSDTARLVAQYAGPAVTLLIIGLIAIDMRRSKTILHYMVLAACVAAIWIYFMLPLLYPKVYS